MSAASPALDTLAQRFAHPAVRVMTRELTQLAHDLEQGARAWPVISQPSAQPDTALPGLEAIEAALSRRQWYRRLAVDQQAWQGFARTIWALLNLSPVAKQAPAVNEPHPAAVIALRAMWGAERFAELPTVVLKPPPAEFLQKLAHLPAPARQAPPRQLDRVVAAWLEQIQPDTQQGRPLLPVTDVRHFVHIVAACRAVGQLRAGLELEDIAAGYLSWARLLPTDLQRLTALSSGWWSPRDRPSRQ